VNLVINCTESKIGDNMDCLLDIVLMSIDLVWSKLPDFIGRKCTFSTLFPNFGK
jgi:hypothetical protein